MHNAGLDGRAREETRDCFGQAFQAVAAEDQNIFYAARLQLGEKLPVALRALAFGQPQAEQFFVAVQVDADGDLQGAASDLALVTDFEKERI